MTRFLTITTIVFRRASANWRLLATVIVGVVLSAGLMSTVSLYSDTVRDLGLQHTLEGMEPFELDLRVTASSQRLNPGEFGRVDADLRSQVDMFERTLLEGSTRFLRSATFFPTLPGVPVDQANEQRPRANLQAAQEFEDHVTFIEGRAPQPATPPADPASAPALEVAVSRAVSGRDGLAVGQDLELHPFWALESAPVSARIVGIFEPRVPGERYWGEEPSRYDGSGTSWSTYPLFVAGEGDIVNVVARYLPTIDGTVQWQGFVDITTVNSRNARTVEDRIRGLKVNLPTAIPRTSVATRLDDTVAEYRTKLFFTRLPLFALMLQVVGIVLYYLVMVATMLQERQAGEIALLRSRGASGYQIIGMAAIEGAFLCGGAVICGPLLATGGIALLGLTPQFSDLSHGELLKVPLTRGAFLMAGLGAALAFLALLWPAYQAARKTMVDYKTSLTRPEQQPVFIRYYLDLVLIGAAAFAFYQLRQRGSLVTERLFGDLSADPLLLISPTLFMLMVALVFIRLFPVALRVVAWAVAGLRGPTVALGMWRMVRSPMHHSRLILLLLLATAVGMFAAGFRATLERSYDDRAAYAAATDALIGDIRTPSGLDPASFAVAVKAHTDAAAVSPVVRADASYNRSLFDSLDVEVLGVVPDEVKSILFWRGDFAEDSLGSLLSRITRDPGYTPLRGPAIPAGSRMLGAWVFLPVSQNVAQPYIRLRDSAGGFWEYRLVGPPTQSPNGQWQFFVADLSQASGLRRNSQPTGATIDAVYLRTSGQSPPFPEKVTVLFDDVQVSPRVTPIQEAIGSQRLPDAVLVEDFEAEGPYELITGASVIGEPGAFSRAEVFDRPGRYAARITYTRQRGTPTAVGLRVREGMEVVPVLVNRSFLKEAALERDDEIVIYYNRQYVRARIVGDFNLFPTYDPEGRTNLMVADIRSLAELGSRVPFLTDQLTPNEAWLSGVTTPLVAEQLAKRGLNAGLIADREALRAEAASDPLVAASWEGILFLSFGAVLALTALGFAVYAVLAARARSLEFAILRTMGYTSRQILALVSFEQLFVIVAGLAVGTALGFPLGRLMIGYLGVTESGRDPLPPLVSKVSWVTVVTVYALLAAVFVATVAALARTYSRVAVARALRIGEI